MDSPLQSPHRMPAYFLRTNLYMSEMSDCICCGCRTDIPTFDISDHNQDLWICSNPRSFCMPVTPGFQTVHTWQSAASLPESRSYVASTIPLLNCQIASAAPSRGLTILLKCLFLNMFRQYSSASGQVLQQIGALVLRIFSISLLIITASS